MKKIFRLSIFVFMFSLCHLGSTLNANSDLPLLDPELKISMDFQDASLKDILKVFSIQSGLNFIASQAVQDRVVTLYLDQVPLSKAMDNLFKANNLSYELDPDSRILIVKDWGEPGLERITKIFNLKYASVSSSKILLQIDNIISDEESGSGSEEEAELTGITEAVIDLLSEQGSVVDDTRTNSLVVTDIPSRMAIIEDVIASLDVATPQVMLEVEMLDVSKNTVDKLGIDWPSSLLQLDTSTTSKMVNLFGEYGTNPKGWTMGIEDTTAGGWEVSDWTAKNFGPTILSVLKTELTLEFLKTRTDTKFLARPRILTQNNIPAEIRIATQETIGIKETTTSAEGTGSTTQEAEREETGVILRVTPQINVDTGEITMFIYPKVAETVAGSIIVSGGSNFNFRDPEERSTKSVVRIKDGETVVIGGLIRNEFSQVESKIPILGDIPLLGYLFRHKGSDNDKNKERELLIFITPHIIKDTETMLAQGKKIRLPEREQNLATGADRELLINNTLNIFESNKK